MRKHGKKRGGRCYELKIARITKWHHRLAKGRANKKDNPPAIDSKTGLPYPKKELRPLSWYIDRIKKPTGETKK